MRLLIIFLLYFFLFTIDLFYTLSDLRDKDEVVSALRTALGSAKVCCGYSSDILRIKNISKLYLLSVPYMLCFLETMNCHLLQYILTAVLPV